MLAQSNDHLITECMKSSLNANFVDLPFDCYQSLIDGQRIYCVNGDIVFRSNNRFIVLHIYESNLRRINFAPCIKRWTIETMH